MIDDSRIERALHLEISDRPFVAWFLEALYGDPAAYLRSAVAAWEREEKENGQ